MRIRNKLLVAEFRGPKCAFCHRYDQAAGLQCHHVMTRGAGGSDIRENLVCLCLFCHNNHHGGIMPRKPQLLEIVSLREGLTVADITDLTNQIRNLPKGSRAEAEAILLAFRRQATPRHPPGQAPDRVPPRRRGRPPKHRKDGTAVDEGVRGWVGF